VSPFVSLNYAAFASVFPRFTLRRAFSMGRDTSNIHRAVHRRRQAASFLSSFAAARDAFLSKRTNAETERRASMDAYPTLELFLTDLMPRVAEMMY